jgi:alkanesulfonate monooxygenase SsuD/methylene tetrahydromethanopterin reductase-like flavin-dependent oxidoreductase (luciferase family)
VLPRLAETAVLARALFDTGWVSESGPRVRAVDLPLAPAPPVPPRLLLGGGSPTLLELAGRVADHLDLAPPAHRRGNQFLRPLVTTVADLAESASVARAAGRSLTTSLLLAGLALCEAGEIRAEEEALCARVGLPWRALGDCPYVLVGEPARVAERLRERQNRIGLDWLIVPVAEVERFSDEVMPLLA